MKIEVLVNLKVGAREIISAGTIFDAPIEELPSWLVSEIEAKSKHIKVHDIPKKTTKAKQAVSEPASKQKPKTKAKIVNPKQAKISRKKSIDPPVKAVADRSGSLSKKKPASLREKLSKSAE